MNLSRKRLFALLALTAGLLILSCDDDGKDPLKRPPESPNLLAIIDIAQTSMTMNWNDRSSTEAGFRIERSLDNQNWQTDGTVGEGVRSYIADGLAAATLYYLRVWAFNESGDSDSPTNVAFATTLAGNLAPVPTNVTAEPLTSSSVLVQWHDNGNVDSFVVRRRETTGDWIPVGSTNDGVEEYTDTGLSAATTYIYSVGSANQSGINWALDSAEVTTPQEGAPPAPSGMSAEIMLGHGVTIHWVDNSATEDGFEISRNTPGQLFETIDTVDANVTSYFDSLGLNTGRFGYRVRAYNELGVSLWAPFITVDYRFCTNGVLPICHGNTWNYIVDGDSVEIPYEIQRSIPPVVEYISDFEHYLMIEHNFSDGQLDSLWYLRNFEGFGCSGANYPLGGIPSSDPLFMYPTSVGAHYNFHGDSIVVASLTFNVQLADTLIQNCIVYQRFLHNQDRSIRYFVKQNTIGIVMEDEVIESTPVLRRTLRSWWVQNIQ